MGVLPAYAGMILAAFRGEYLDQSAPRVCGDDPGEGVAQAAQQACSPRMRG